MSGEFTTSSAAPTVATDNGGDQRTARDIIDIRMKPPMRDSEADPRLQAAPGYAQYQEIYGTEDLINLPVPQLISEMQAANVRGVLQAEHEWGTDAEYNDRVAELLQSHPDRFICGFASVDPRNPTEAIKELNRAHGELGLRGAVFEPGFLDISPLDPRCYPVYSRCSELGIPVGLHTGVNFSSHGPIDNGRPLHVDRVACDFPDLVIICHHGGWPWPHEAVAIAWKHPNVFLEFGAIAPRYLADRGGWGDTVRFMDTVIRGQVLFGTDWPMLRYERAFEEIAELDLREESRRSFLHDNAMRLLERIL